MERETEKEFERVHKRIDKVEEEQEKQDSMIQRLARDILRFWHLGLGISVGLILREIGLEKLIGKLL